MTYIDRYFEIPFNASCQSISNNSNNEAFSKHVDDLIKFCMGRHSDNYKVNKLSDCIPFVLTCACVTVAIPSLIECNIPELDLYDIVCNIAIEYIEENKLESIDTYDDVKLLNFAISNYFVA